MANNFDRSLYRDLLEAYLASGENSQVAKRKLKAAATSGFNLGMYDLDDNSFDRKEFRKKTKELRKSAPEYTRRQRRAAALVDSVPQETAPTVIIPNVGGAFALPGPLARGGAEVIVGAPAVEDVMVDPNKVKMTVYENTYGPRKLSFDQFAGMLDDLMYKQGALNAGQDLKAWQVHRAKEYEKYAQNPQQYVYTAIDPSFVYSNDDIVKYHNLGLLSNNRGAGYYNPNDVYGKHMFYGKSWEDVLRENGVASHGATYTFENSNGLPVTEEQLASIVPKINNPRAKRAVNQHLSTSTPVIVEHVTEAAPITGQTNAGQAPRDRFYNAMNNVAVGTTALAVTPAFLQYVAKPTIDAVRELGPMSRRTIQNGRDTYGRMLEENSRNILKNNYPGKGGNAWVRQNTVGNGPLRPYNTFGGARNLV